MWLRDSKYMDSYLRYFFVGAHYPNGSTANTQSPRTYTSWQVTAYLRARLGARLAVLPSTAESAGYTLAELLHASVPLVAVDSGAVCPPSGLVVCCCCWGEGAGRPSWALSCAYSSLRLRYLGSLQQRTARDP